MSQKNNKKRRKENLLTFDLTVENPEDIIAADKDENRKNAFKEAYKVIANIIPEYFITRRKKRNNSSSSGGTAFSQNIVVTADKATVQTKEVVENTKQEIEKEDRERE